MRAELVDLLACPLSGGRLTVHAHEREGDDILSGTLTSASGTYPIVAGIPVLRAGGEEVVRLLEEGDHRGATAVAAFGGLPTRRTVRLVSALTELPIAGRVAAMALDVIERGRRRADVAAIRGGASDPLAPVRHAYVSTPGRSIDAFAYFAYRFSMPRHLVGLSCIDALLPDDGPVLDLGCGAGHLTWAIAGRARREQIIGVDRELFLLLAARHLAPTADLVCADLQALPFRSRWASTAFAFDVLSFVTQKAAVVREIERVLDDGGRLALTSVKNALVDHVFAGEPLPPAGWRAPVGHLEHRVLADGDIVQHYLEGVGLPAKQEPPPGELDRSRLLTVIAAKGDGAFDDAPMFDDWPHARGDLAVNPLFQPAVRLGECVRYVRTLPDGAYGADNPELDSYLPTHLDIADDTAARAAAGERPDELEPHIRRFGVLALPSGLVADRWPTPPEENTDANQ